ncbi:hypothetical protein [Bradyrhizobium sp.]|uniref:hypothetical protein n=1 Tax=Bradyrhizobium sp. TaxID=376 RepID=UPI00273578C0|nr:hypothetical protein [Bradyrhizobium sp.]MDP3690076.1 hypothetical protein [Bradyrhizobium sp.]
MLQLSSGQLVINTVNLTVSGWSRPAVHKGPGWQGEIEDQAASMAIPYHAPQPKKSRAAPRSLE